MLYSEKKTKLKKFNKSICESIMKTGFISPSNAPSDRFKAVNLGLPLKALSEINPAINSSIVNLFVKKLNQVGC
jgi:hypothetical protein